MDPSLRLVVGNLGTFAASFPPPPVSLTGAQTFWGIFQHFIRPAGFSALSPDYSLGRGRLTDRPWPQWSLGERGGGFVMAALTRTSPTIFSRLVSDCQA